MVRFVLRWLLSTHKYADDPFKQQRLPDLQPKLSLIGVISIYFVIGIIFLPLGIYLRKISNAVVEYTVKYDGSNADLSGCSISQSNVGSNCNVILINFHSAVTEVVTV